MSLARRSSPVGRLSVLAALALVMARAPAAAHSMAYELRGSGDARVVFRYGDGTPMVSAAFRVFAPGDDVDPVATGLTDSAGEAGFGATSDGQWRVEASDSTGQAIRARIDVTKGLPAVAGHRIPDWLAAFSLSLNVLLAVWLALGRRFRSAGRRDAPARPEASRQHGTIAP